MNHQQQNHDPKKDAAAAAAPAAITTATTTTTTSLRGTLRLKKRPPPEVTIVVKDHDDDSDCADVNAADADADADAAVAVIAVAPALQIVALDRPRVKNAINDDVYLDLTDVLHTTAADPQCAGIVLTGTGPYFTSGADLKESFATTGSGGSIIGGGDAGDDDDNNNKKQKTVPMHDQPAGRFMLALLSYPKLLCAAVNGPAVGIGTTLLLHCDLVFASPNTTLWAPFTRLALVPELCSSVTFQRTMGLAKANELLLLGKSIDAKTAVEWGICSRVVESPSFEGDDDTLDPFHPSSLASQMAAEVESRLLQLPKACKTIEYFVSLIRGARTADLKHVCLKELQQLDERRAAGDVQEAMTTLQRTLQAQKEHKVKHRIARQSKL